MRTRSGLYPRIPNGQDRQANELFRYWPVNSSAPGYRPSRPWHELVGFRPGELLRRNGLDLGIRIVWMLEPGDPLAHFPASPFVDLAGLERDNRDAVFHRANQCTEIASYTFFLNYFEMPLAVLHLRDRLVRCVLAGDMAAAAFNAQILVDNRFDCVVEVEELPIGCMRNGSAAEFSRGAITLLVHPGLEPGDHLLNDFEAVDHRRSAHLHIARTQGDKLGRITPGFDPADGRDRKPSCCRRTRNLSDHIQGNRLYSTSAITAMSCLSVGMRPRGHLIEVDSHDRVDRVDKRHGIGPPSSGSLGGLSYVGDIGRELHDNRHARVGLAPSCDHFDIFGNLADSRAHAAFGHAMRTPEVELYPVCTRIFNPSQDCFPIALLARHHE